MTSNSLLAVAAVTALHAEIDRRVQQLTAQHRLSALGGPRLRCGLGCSACCIDDLTVFEVEAERIRAALAPWLRTTTPHARGSCAFLGPQKECRAYSARPYVCRTQGLPLRWFEETESGDIEEESDICELNRDGPPLTSLNPNDFWLIGPYEEKLMDLQEQYFGTLRRVPLRDLFE